MKPTHESKLVDVPQCRTDELLFRKNRTNFDVTQVTILERAFDKSHYPDSAVREQLARQTGLSKLKVQVWFQNRRAKFRRNTKTKQQNDDKQEQTPVIIGPKYATRHFMFTAQQQYHFFCSHVISPSTS